jgi:hypothetical protein
VTGADLQVIEVRFWKPDVPLSPGPNLTIAQKASAASKIQTISDGVLSCRQLAFQTSHSRLTRM